MTDNEENENRRTNIDEGNYNERIEGNYVQGNRNLIFNIFNFRRLGSSEALTSAKHSHIRQTLLKQVNLEVESRIKSSLHNRVYIFLDAEQNPEQVELPWGSEIKVGSKPKIRLDNTDIINVVDQEDIAGRLLILGQPGSGKTTMLLKLAEELVKRAKNNSTHPVAVLFSLSSWKNDNQNIKDWLVEQFKDKYGVRKDIGKKLVDNQEIIPLLDGLDELAAERQENCVIKINDFLHAGWSNPLVVCSRIEEYQRYKALLKLNNSLELCPLAQEQVYQYLQNIGHLQLWDSINHNADLNQLARTPFLLNIIVLSAQEISIENWQHFKSSEERLSYLFDAYICRMLKRSYKAKQPKQENTKRWLSWLAQRLIEENTTEFLIERMQPSWLKNNNSKSIYTIIVYLAFALIFGLSGLTGALIVWLFYGFAKENNAKAILKSLTGITLALIFVYLVIVPYIYLASYPIAITGSSHGNKLWGNNFWDFIINHFPFFCRPLNTNKLKKEIKNYEKINFLLQVFSMIFAGTINFFYVSLLYKFYHAHSNFYYFDFEINYTTYLAILINLIGAILSTYCLLSMPKITQNIQVIESFKWSWLIAKKKIASVMLFGIFNGILAMLFYYLRSYNIVSSSRYLLSQANVIFVTGILFSGLLNSDIEVRRIPNQGIIVSSVNALTIGFIVGLIYGLTSWVQTYNLTVGLNNELIFALTSCLSGVLIGALLGGGGACLQHFVLRVVLWFNGYAPWNYAKFLNYCTNRLFLQRVGGSYRFMHDLLRQHFANSYEQKI